MTWAVQSIAYSMEINLGLVHKLPITHVIHMLVDRKAKFKSIDNRNIAIFFVFILLYGSSFKPLLVRRRLFMWFFFLNTTAMSDVKNLNKAGGKLASYSTIDDGDSSPFLFCFTHSRDFHNSLPKFSPTTDATSGVSLLSSSLLASILKYNGTY